MAEENGEDSSVMRIGKRCYVGNLAWKTSWQDLKDKFRDVGNVVYANVMRDDGGECRVCASTRAADVARRKNHCRYLNVGTLTLQVDQRDGALSSSKHQKRYVVLVPWTDC